MVVRDARGFLLLETVLFLSLTGILFGGFTCLAVPLYRTRSRLAVRAERLEKHLKFISVLEGEIGKVSFAWYGMPPRVTFSEREFILSWVDKKQEAHSLEIRDSSAGVQIIKDGKILFPDSLGLLLPEVKIRPLYSRIETAQGIAGILLLYPSGRMSPVLFLDQEGLKP